MGKPKLGKPTNTGLLIATGYSQRDPYQKKKGNAIEKEGKRDLIPQKKKRSHKERENEEI